MSLDVYLERMELTEVFSSNITHNLGAMAREAGIYKHLWHPEELGITTASQLIEPLKEGRTTMLADPERFKAFNAKNGWGTYEQFIRWLSEYIQACEEHPNATVRTST